jgi:hypothetical protein
VIFAIVVLAAVGDASLGSGPAKRTAYLVTDGGDAVINSVRFPIHPNIIGSYAIQQRALASRER